MSLIETQQLDNGKVLEIHYDSEPENPRNWDNISEFIFFHKRYTLGDSHKINPNDYSSFDEMVDANTKKGDIVLPVYMYEHSGIAIATTPFNCRWDSGLLGFAVVRKEKIIKEYGKNTKKNREIATKVLEGEIETYNQYLQGNVYGFKLKDKDGNELDSCWGFYDTKDIMEYI
jgi:hypothetical protein